MHQRHDGLTPEIAAGLTQAACVCLDRHYAPPTNVSIADNGQRTVASVTWDVTSDQVRAAWANELDATRDGAYAMALAGVEVITGLVGVRRAETLTGADYWLAEPDATTEHLEGRIRLEVSGVDIGGPQVIGSRLAAKLRQLERGKSGSAGIACVVGFRERLIRVGTIPAS